MSLLALATIAVAVLVLLSDGERVAVPSPADSPVRSAAGVEVSVAGGARRARLQIDGDDPLRLLFIGDSLRGAVFASRPERGYVARVARVIGRKHAVEVLDATRISKRPGKARGVVDVKAVPAAVDLAVLELGTNDVNHVPLGRFRRQYRHLVAMVRRSSPNAALLCLGVWSTPRAPELSLDPYNKIIAQQCAGGRYVSLADLRMVSAFHGPEGRATWDGPGDAFHPNDAGYAAIAQRILEHLSV